ncbi:MFS transporter [Silvibacterium sp.]|uniref:MFS transporter n=1 Tax=Silvibacterium sp. TaxID=1964179 RepID=UPI0039E44EB0
MKRGVFFIFTTVFLDMLALGLVAPSLPQLIAALTHGSSARVAIILGNFGTVFALMQFLFSPVLGTLSDRFGRRPIILLSNFGLAVDYILMALAPSISWLMCGRILAGITSANMTAANAYIADKSDSGERAKEFGYLGVACALGFIVGPGIGGTLSHMDARLPFWFAALLSCSNGICTLLLLPESLPAVQRRNISFQQLSPLTNLQILRNNPQLLRLCSVTFLNSLAGVVLPSLYVLYVADRFHWDSRSAGLSLMLAGFSAILALATLVKPIIAQLGERGTVVLALLCGATGMTIFGCAENGMLFLAGIPLFALWGLAPAAAQSFMTRSINATEQGQLQGALASISGVATLFGPALFTGIYSHSCLARACNDHPLWSMPGAAWLCSTILLLCAAGLMLSVSGTRVIEDSMSRATIETSTAAL